MNTFKSDISGEEFPISDRISAKAVRKSIMSFIKKDHPKFTREKFLSISELNFYRGKYLSQILLREAEDISRLESIVLDSLKDKSMLSDKLESEKMELTKGQIFADGIATFGGSWKFILFFTFFIVVWIFLNVLLYSNSGFDPYPFILLNLILSCLAALQAPVIMMSQNRQEEKDRERSKNDYMINLKSELEIRMLHEKLDHLIMHQQQELLEIQKIQIDMMKNITEYLKEK